MLRIGKKLLQGAMLMTLASGAFAGAYTTNNPTIAAGASGTVTVSFAGDGATQDSQWDFTYDTAVLTPSAAMILVPGSVCSIFPAAGMVPAFVRISPPSGAGTPVTSTNTAYCSFSFAVAGAAPNGASPFATRFIECEGSGGPVAPCTASGSVTVGPGGGGGTAPTASLTAGTLSAGAIGGTATGDVAVNVLTAGTAPGTLGLTCTLPAGANSFLITGGANRTITAPATLGANAPPIGVSCVRTAAAATATVTCAQNATPDPDPAALTALVTCPAGAAGDVSPNIAFAPNPLTLTGTGTATGNLVGTPSGGTGTATTTATCVDDAGGPLFTITPAARTFTGNVATTQSYAIGCTTAPAAATGTVTCSQVQSDGTNPAPTSITVNCPASAAGATPEFNSTPPAGTTISLNGTQGGTNPTGQVSVTNSEAATTLIVSAAVTGVGLSVAPAGPVNIVPGTPQAFTVTCSAAAVGTFNGTLTLTTNDPDDNEAVVTYPVTCSIIAGGGGTQATAVPTLSSTGKLIAIFSVLGLGLLGFAVTRRS